MVLEMHICFQTDGIHSLEMGLICERAHVDRATFLHKLSEFQGDGSVYITSQSKRAVPSSAGSIAVHH